MKKQKQFLVSLLLFQVLLITSTEAFSFSSTTLDLDSRLGSFFKTYQNEKAVLFEESSSKNEVNFSFEDDLHSFTLETSFNSQQGHSDLALWNYSEIPLNRKELLKIQIFPFHFFW